MQQLLWRRTMLTLLSLVMLTGMLAACSGKTEQAAEPAANAPAGEVPYPASLTYWAPIGNAGTVMKSFSDMGRIRSWRSGPVRRSRSSIRPRGRKPISSI